MELLQPPNLFDHQAGGFATKSTRQRCRCSTHRQDQARPTTHKVSEIVLFQVFVHVEEGDSGLNQGESSFNIHFKNFVHMASKIESNAARPSPADTTATNIPFDRERPDQYLELVAQTRGSL